MLPSDETFLTTFLAIARIGAVAVTLPTLARPAEILKIVLHADLHMLFAAKRYRNHDYVERIEEAVRGISGQRMPYRLPEVPYLREVWLWGDGTAPVWARQVELTREPTVDATLLSAAEAQVHSSDPAVIVYTSGSTADPKGIIHSQGSCVRQGMKVAASMKYKSDERAYAPLPFFWVGGLMTTAMCIMCVGATMIDTEKTGAERLDFLERERITTVIVWPHMIRGLVAEPTFKTRDWSSIRNGVLFEALPLQIRPKDAGLIATPFGMTETSAIYTILDINLPEDQRGSVGPLQRGVESRLVDVDTGKVIAHWADGDWAADSAGKVGLQQVRSDVMMLGMVKRENADVFTPDGWYPTGDLCAYRRGHLHYHGRADDLIKAAGANVSPREVEAVLLQYPGVAAAHATAVPDRERGSMVGAVVVPQDGVELDVNAIRREAEKSLASYKAPRVLIVVERSKVPTLPSSKVDRRALAQLLQDAHEANG
jgi:acyl-CoA synthetase (AMP-forming)/AMP-acid ligase II